LSLITQPEPRCDRFVRVGGRRAFRAGGEGSGSTLDEGDCQRKLGNARISAGAQATAAMAAVVVGAAGAVDGLVRTEFQIADRVAGQLGDQRLGSLTGMTPEQLQDLANNPNALQFVDNATGNTNTVQVVDGSLLRITTAGDDPSKIISVGPIQRNGLFNGIAKGRFEPVIPQGRRITMLQGDLRVQERASEVEALLNLVCGSEEFPFFVSDEATLLDVCSLDPEEIVARLTSRYGRTVQRDELLLPIWQLVAKMFPYVQ
jgi:hypothetical protein